MRFFWAFSTLLSMSAPLGLLCAFGAGYKNISRRLHAQGAAIAGARQANVLRGTEEVVLTESELFPSGSIALEALQNMGQMPDERILTYAAALAKGARLELGRLLEAIVQEQYGVSVPPVRTQVVEGGLIGEIGGNRIIFGTSALMVRMGMRIRAGGQTLEQANAHVVFGETLVGTLSLRYEASAQTYHAMRLMRRMRMNAALAVIDFNISPAMVEREFDLRHGFADELEPSSIARVLTPEYTQADAPVAILTRDGAGPMVQVLRSADKLVGAVRSNIILGAFAGGAGMLIASYLLFYASVDALSVKNLLLYLLLWYAPAFLITQQTY